MSDDVIIDLARLGRGSAIQSGRVDWSGLIPSSHSILAKTEKRTSKVLKIMALAFEPTTELSTEQEEVRITIRKTIPRNCMYLHLDLHLRVAGTTVAGTVPGTVLVPATLLLFSRQNNSDLSNCNS